MLPILVHVASVRVYTFGAFLVLAFFWGSFLIWKNIRISKYDEETAFDIVLFSFLNSLIIGRIWYVILHFSDFQWDVLKILLVNGYPGTSILGMLIGFFSSLYILSQRKKIKAFEFIDYITPSLALFTAISELGSLFVGSEQGKSIGLLYTHPVSLYGAIVMSIGAFLLQKALYNIRKDILPKGFSVYIFLWFFSLSYVIQYFLKDKRALWIESKIEYWLFLGLLLTFGFYFVYYFRDLILKTVIQFINLITGHVKKTIKTIFAKTSKDHRR